MPHIYTLPTPGAPTFTDKSASPSSFGLDDFVTPIDPDLMDREWYHGQDYYPHTALHAHSRLSPADDVLTAVAFNYPAHTEPGSEALTGMSTSPFISCSFFRPMPRRLFASTCRQRPSRRLRCLRALLRATRGSPSAIAYHRVISLVDSQSHVTGALKMPQLDTSPTMELPLPHELSNCHWMRSSTLMPRPRHAVPTT